MTFSQSLIPCEQGDIILDQVLYAVEQILDRPDDSYSDWTHGSQTILSIVPAEIDSIPSDIEYLHEFVVMQRQSHPNKIALEFASSIEEDKVEKQTWSYRELDDMGNRIANFLSTKGVNTGDLVAVCFDKCPEASFAMLGILKAGCGFLALDQSAPKDRKLFIMKDSNTKLVLSMKQFKDTLVDEVGPEIVFLDEDLSIMKTYSSNALTLKNTSPHDTCYCLYTSGKLCLKKLSPF